PLISWFQPEMQPDFGACEEFCNDCARVCPTGAIRNLGVEEKRQLQIGVAKVTRDDCLAWTEGEHCMVCQEFCPYGAIDTRTSRAGIPRPVVNEKKCRGCGFCQNACPAIRNGKAILVHGVDAQRIIGESP
ncbi:MAG: 4Fe-4S dicluster domain-containing protein, partial [Kiritimatiellae bacterium]|nr:4Fe-4S dicluster domain-containing protein [Kiritimatiellia bacterium]